MGGNIIKELFEIYDGSAEAKKAKGKSKNLSGFHPLFTASARRSIALDGFRPIGQVLFCEWKEDTIIANDSHLRGDTMLNIYFGDMPEAVYNTSVYFNYTYEDEWLTSDFAKEVIRKIDKSDVKGLHAVESPVLGVISPEKLSGGTKTLLLMANDPEKVFNASTCGDNCAPFILKLAKKKDLTINLRHLMDFGKKNSRWM